MENMETSSSKKTEKNESGVDMVEKENKGDSDLDSTLGTGLNGNEQKKEDIDASNSEEAATTDVVEVIKVAINLLTKA